jgi:hypothetical protein
LITALLAGSSRSAALLLGVGANADLPDGRGRIARTLAGSDARLAVAYPPGISAPNAHADGETGQPPL